MGHLPLGAAGGEGVDLAAEKADAAGQVGHIVAPHLRKAAHQLLHQRLGQEEHTAGCAGGEGGGVVRPVVEQGRRAEEIPRLQHTHDERALVHLHPALQHHAQAAAEGVRGVNHPALTVLLPECAGVGPGELHRLRRRTPEEKGLRQSGPLGRFPAVHWLSLPQICLIRYSLV